MFNSSFSLALPLMYFLHTLPVPLYKAPLAPHGTPLIRISDRGAGDRFDVGRRRRLTSSAVTLVRGLARDRIGNYGIATVGASVVDLYPISVLILGYQRVTGEEVGINA